MFINNQEEVNNILDIKILRRRKFIVLFNISYRHRESAML